MTLTTVTVPHPLLAGVSLVLELTSTRSRAAWVWRGRALWRGLPCEA